MALPVAAEPIPFLVDADGVARVGGTRATLEAATGRQEIRARLRARRSERGGSSP